MRLSRFFLLVFFFSSSLLANNPKISIITSLYKGETFIEGFMQDIVQQTIFDQCELIIINANSPENEEPFIRPYLEKYPNIFYFELEKDPGLYAVWNIAIELARGEFITNANVDDRLSHVCYETYLKNLEEHPKIDLVYSNPVHTHTPNETFENNTAVKVFNRAEFAPNSMKDCLPGPNPMWRKKLHEKHGMFDESFKHSGDWEMWCRAVAGGARFLKVPGTFCLYFYNPQGLSTSRKIAFKAAWEDGRIRRTYGFLWKD